MNRLGQGTHLDCAWIFAQWPRGGFFSASFLQCFSIALSETPRSLAIRDVGFSQINFSSASADGQTILARRGGGGFRLDTIGAFNGTGLGRRGRGGRVGGKNVLADPDSTGRFL